MTRMFENTRNFDQDISGWDVSKVESMDRMFILLMCSTRYYRLEYERQRRYV